MNPAHSLSEHQSATGTARLFLPPLWLEWPSAHPAKNTPSTIKWCKRHRRHYSEETVTYGDGAKEPLWGIQTFAWSDRSKRWKDALYAKGVQITYSKCTKLLIFKTVPTNCARSACDCSADTQQQKKEKPVRCFFFSRANRTGIRHLCTGTLLSSVWASTYSERPVALSALAVKTDCFMTFQTD